MTLNIKLKRSSTKDSAPTSAQLEDGELGVNYNKDSLRLYVKDSDGTVRTIAGKDSEGSYWNLSGTDLSPTDNTYGVNLGADKVRLFANGTGTFTGKVTSASTVAGDGATTLTTKDYVDAQAAGETLQEVTDNGDFTTNDIKIGGTDASPKIKLNSGGTVSATNNVEVGTIGSANAKIFKEGNAEFYYPAKTTYTFINNVSGTDRFVEGGTYVTSTPTFKWRLNNVDGSITAAGQIDITGQGGFAGYGWAIANNGGIANKTPTGRTFFVDNMGNVEAAGDVKIGGTSAAPNIELKASDGSITAAGSVNTSENIFTGNKYANDIGGLITKSGSLQLRCDDGSDFITCLKDNNDASKAKFKVDTDGSITGKGRANFGSDSLNDYAVAGFSDSAVDGGVYAQNDNASGRLFTGQQDTTEVFSVDANGQGRFKGRLRVDSYIESYRSSSGESVFSGYQGSDLNVNITAGGNITAAGSGTFGTDSVVIDGVTTRTKVGIDPGGYKSSGQLVPPSAICYLPTGYEPSRITYANIDGSGFDTTFAVTAGGSITAEGKIQSGGNPFQGTANGTLLTSSGGCLSSVAGGTNETFLGYTTGTTDPTFKVLGNGSASFAGVVTGDRTTNTDSSFEAKNAGTLNAKIRCDGTYFGQDNAIQPISSERRLKENIVPVDKDVAWETIKSTPYYAYNFIGQERTVYGPMADEVPAEMVVQPMEENEQGVMVARSDDQGLIRSYDNSMLQGRLYTALQTALERIEALEAEVNALKSA